MAHLIPLASSGFPVDITTEATLRRSLGVVKFAVHSSAVARAAEAEWTDVDLTKRQLCVERSDWKGNVTAPKGGRLRYVPLTTRLAAALHHHRHLKGSRVLYGNRSGQWLRESKVLRNVLQPAAKKAGLGRVTWHQFRHIHSSLLNDLKVPVKIAQEQLGHASISTTLNIYTHVVDASHRKAIEALERELFPSVPKLPDGPKPADSASRDFRVA